MATKEIIDELIADGKLADARYELTNLFREAPTLSHASLVLAKLSKIDIGTRHVKLRVAFLRSFTLEPVLPLLKASAALSGIEIEARCGEFNTYTQDIIDPNSWLYSFDPRVVVIAVQTRDIAPELWSGWTQLGAGAAERIVADVVNDLTKLIQALRERSSADVIVHGLELPIAPAAGIVDGQQEQSQVASILNINKSLRDFISTQSGVHFFDYDALIAYSGRSNWYDEKKWLTARLPFAVHSLSALAEAYLKFLFPISGKICKALAIDLDNTLWGGVVGEDGFHGIKMGAEYPGAAYRELQLTIRDLYARGVILAICSKNNYADAYEVLEKHPDMVLRPEHFAVFKINWTEKCENLKQVATELNIGIDAIAFIDDNPVERQRVREELPEVTVIDLPNDPMAYAKTLRCSPVFERLSLSTEDQERGRYYADQRLRTELASSSGSLEDFYRSLNMTSEIDKVNDETLARTAQLTQKTNQFNLTTRRYTQQEIGELMNDSSWDVVTTKIEDRFGDNGLVGVAILRSIGITVEIDTLLMSCRVIGRTVETAMLADLIERARGRGAEKIQGWYLRTKKNEPCKEFYADHGFQCIAESDEGQLWSLTIANGQISRPEWIRLKGAGK